MPASHNIRASKPNREKCGERRRKKCEEPFHQIHKCFCIFNQWFCFIFTYTHIQWKCDAWKQFWYAKHTQWSALSLLVLIITQCFFVRQSSCVRHMWPAFCPFLCFNALKYIFHICLFSDPCCLTYPISSNYSQHVFSFPSGHLLPLQY